MRPPAFLAAAALLVFNLIPDAVPTASAQSSLFSIPTASVLEPGETYLEADFEANFARLRQDRWQYLGVMAVRGVNRRFEIGLNAYATRSADGFEPLELQPNFKLRVYENESTGVSAAAGAIGYLPLKSKFRQSAAVSVYAVASKQFSGDKAPQITGGAYQLVGATPDGTASRGFLVGLEQPLFKRTTFIADWNSGRNRFGYAAAGLGVALTKRSSLYSAYYFGNEGRGNNFLGIYYSHTF